MHNKDHERVADRGRDDELLTIGEVADIVRVPVATLRYWRHLGTGPRSFRVGRGVRYWHHEVTTWLQDQSDGPTDHRQADPQQALEGQGQGKH